MKLINRYRKGDKLLKVYENNLKNGKCYRGVLYAYEYSSGDMVPVMRESKNFFGEEMTEANVLKHYDMFGATIVDTDRYIDPKHRSIWRNDNYSSWKEYIEKYEEGYDSSYEQYARDMEDALDCERVNLNVSVKGCIVAFADLGLWDGRHLGGKVIGDKVKSILYSDCDYLDWYCDRYDVRCKAVHHDGTNHILYRVAKDLDDANRLVNLIADGKMDEDAFKKATRSLRPYVVKVYGF